MVNNTEENIYDIDDLEENLYDDKKNTKKKNKKKRRKKKRPLLRIIVFIAIIGGLYYFGTSEFFDINEIEVRGNNHYTEEQIREKSGIKIGQNLFKLNIRNARNKILKDPYFKNVDIDRKLPKKIVINVTEREEIAIVKVKKGYSVIDIDGLVLRMVDKPLNLTEITGFNEVKNKIGKPLEVIENTRLNETLKMLDTMRKSEIYFKKIAIEKVLVKAYIYDQLICQGTPENISKSISNEVLESTLYDLYGKGIERGSIKVGTDDYCSFSPEVE